MSNAKFHLKDKNSKKETSIFILFSYEGRRLKLATGLKIHPKYWNGERAKRTMTGSPEFNLALAKCEGAINDIYRNAKLKDENINDNLLRERYNDVLSGKQEDKIEFFDFLDSFIEDYKLTKKASTIKDYESFKRRILKFQTFRKSPILFHSIDKDFYDEICGYFYKELDYSNNSVGKVIKMLKTVIRAAYEKDIEVNQAFMSKKFRAIKEETDNIYLSIAELDRIIGLNLSFTPHLARARDLFIVGCFTGLRYSDFKNIKPESIKENVIELTTQKTEDKVIIPIHPEVKKVMAKYDTPNSLPPYISNMKLNKLLKEIGELAQLDEIVTRTETNGGTRTQKQYKKYELITTHTARRSFATNAYLKSVPTLSIMKITGHKTERTFLNYIKISQAENARKLLEHEFFK